MLNLVITRGLPGGIFAVTLDHGGKSLSTAGEDAPIVLVQSWIDERQVLVDIADRELMRYVARLRARPVRDEGAVGTLEVEGKTYRVRCEQS